jgi:phosphate-selective porin OprO/OprP
MNSRQIVIGLLAVTLAATARAQQSSNVDQRLEQLEQEIRVLKRLRENDEEKTAAAEKAKQAPIITANPKDGFSIKSADGDFGLKFGGQLKADARFYFDNTAARAANTFLIRSARIILDGKVFKDFEFRIAPDFGAGTTALYDGYIGWKHWPELTLRAGKFKPPVGLERLQTDVYNWFSELGLTSQLVPNRDIGLQIGGGLWGDVFTYAVGVFNGGADNSTTTDTDFSSDKDVVARIFAHPFRRTNIKPLQGFGVGAAVSWRDQAGSAASSQLASFKTAGQQTFFTYAANVYASGERIRVAPQFYYYWGRLGLLGEYVINNQRVQLGGNSSNLENTAWQIAGSFLLTDDESSYNGVNPKRPFNPAKGDWGAWEVIARFNRLNVDSRTFPTYASLASSAREAEAWGLGLNWYLNKNLRAAVDFEQTQFQRGATVGDRATEQVVFTRFQVTF